MTDVKWIKIYTGMVSNKKIKRIRTLPEGNNIVLIWVFLLAQAGECNKNGALYLTDTIPFRAEDLAVEFGFEVTVINLALSVLERFSMIEIFDEVIYIKNWGEYQNIDGLEKIREQTRLRVSSHRERQRLSAGVITCQYCGLDATGEDHVIATSRGGSDKQDNKVPCCIECNRIKNDKPLVDFLNSNSSRIKDELVLSNPILSKYVTLCNVTHRYIVTQGNAIELEQELDKEKETTVVILQPDEAAFISILESVKNYPIDRAKDIEMYKTMQERYPTINLLEAIKDWSVYKLDNPLKKGTNPRSQINTSFKKCVDWGKNLKQVEAPKRQIRM